MNKIETAAFEYLIGPNNSNQSEQLPDLSESSRVLLANRKFTKRASELACNAYRAFIKMSDARYWRYNIWDPNWEDEYVERLLVKGQNHADTAKRIYTICGGFKDKNILDAGCGFGIAATEMARLGGNVTGIDINNDVLHIAKMVAVSLGISPRQDINFQKAALESIPYPSDSFDIIWSGNTVEHVANFKRSMYEMHRVLKPGGLMFVRGPNYFRISEEPHFKTLWPPFLPRAVYRWLLSKDYQRRAANLSHVFNGKSPKQLLELAKPDLFSYLKSLNFIKPYQISIISNGLKQVDWSHIRSSYQPARVAWKKPLKYIWHNARLDILFSDRIFIVLTKNANLEEQLKSSAMDIWP